MKLSEISQKPVAVVEAENPEAPDLKGKEPVEIEDIIKYFPKHYEKALHALWGNPRLHFHGEPIFDTVFDKIGDGLDEAIKQGLEVPMSIPVEGTDELDMDSLDYDATISDKQEVYLGYSPSEDSLYVGIDAWLNEEDFNEAWDREFENATGEEFDHENEEHAKVFDSAWKNYRDNGFVGMLFKVDDKGNVDEELAMPGGFYRGIYRTPTFKNYDLVDLRLD